MAPNILVLTGETSAEILTAPIIERIKEKSPDTYFWGIGGDRFKKLDFFLIEHIKNLSVMGFFDIFSKTFTMAKLYRRIFKELDKRKPEIIIFVDFPGFNMRLAERIYNKRNKKTKPILVYYITPQIWAWDWKRIEKLKKYFDHLIPVLPFEYHIFKREGINNVHYFGHPLLEIVKPLLCEDEFRKRWGIQKDFIVLMPGSRKKEIKRLLPEMLLSFRDIRRRVDIEGVLVSAPYMRDMVDRMVKGVEGLVVVDGPCYEPL
ncbi:MAG: hypothetical protein ACPL6C_02150, partial [bacterium]